MIQRPDGHAFTEWLTLPRDGYRDVADVEMDFIRSRLRDLRCPFCNQRRVDLVRSTCVCHRKTLAISCRAPGCVAAVYVHEGVLSDAPSPLVAARALRLLWRGGEDGIGDGAGKLVWVGPDRAPRAPGGGIAAPPPPPLRLDRDDDWEPPGPMEPPRPWDPREDE